MPVIKKKKCVPYTPEQMYALVNDVEAYAVFLPWCEASEVLERTFERVCARLCVGKGGISKSFTTENRLQPPHRFDIDLVDGPFKRLRGSWQFMPQGEGRCVITLDLDFAFSSSWLAACFGPVFTPLAQSMMDAFIARAQEVYGHA